MHLISFSVKNHIEQRFVVIHEFDKKLFLMGSGCFHRQDPDPFHFQKFYPNSVRDHIPFKNGANVDSEFLLCGTELSC
jgi:hypothetical protein